MKPRTRQHLRRAERNAQLAQRLASEASPSEWVLVVAFYAAVHFVAAHLWEIAGIDVQNHREREQFIRTSASLKLIAEAYQRLYDDGYNVRYAPVVRLQPNAIPDALGDLAQIRTVILAALDATQA